MIATQLERVPEAPAFVEGDKCPKCGDTLMERPGSNGRSSDATPTRRAGSPPAYPSNPGAAPATGPALAPHRPLRRSLRNVRHRSRCPALRSCRGPSAARPPFVAPRWTPARAALGGLVRSARAGQRRPEGGVKVLVDHVRIRAASLDAPRSLSYALATPLLLQSVYLIRLLRNFINARDHSRFRP